ncbi:uncharacterized protein [Physcomitrium patens]|nr:uncharacterized protein LOC112283341 [Physcomitrium patens]|eukprot:XP_024377696.1 uncharacterized protein LOC112283341 [Physcomitrella patens]
MLDKMQAGVRVAAAQELEIARRKFMTESILTKRERERELKRHRERIQNMKPCVNSKPSLVRNLFPVRINRAPVRSRINKEKLQQIEKQNYQLLMKLRYIHKNYSLYMPKKHVYLLKGEACSLSKPGKKPAKSGEMAKNIVETSRPFDMHFTIDEEMASRVAAMHLRKTK